MKSGGIYMTNKSGIYLLVVVANDKYVMTTMLTQEPNIIRNTITVLKGTDDREWYQLPYVAVHEQKHDKEPVAHIHDYVINSLAASTDFIQAAFQACQAETIKQTETTG